MKNYKKKLNYFFYDDFLGFPEGFYDADRCLLAIRINQAIGEGRTNEFQQATIHETGHFLGFDSNIVGHTFCEGFALLFEDMFCKANEIPFNLERHDDGYIYGFELVNSAIKNIYHSNLEQFFLKAKSGQEILFVNDFNSFLLQKSCVLDSEEFIRLTSLMFYAKEQNFTQLKEVKHDIRILNYKKKLLDIIECETAFVKSTDVNSINIMVNIHQSYLIE